MAPKLEWSEALGRITRTESIAEQGILTWDLVRDAIAGGRPEEAVRWLRYIKDGENHVKPGRANQSMLYIQALLTYIGGRYGEEHVEAALRWWRRKLLVAGHEPSYDMTPLERVRYHAEMARADYSGLRSEAVDVLEEDDRYVMVLDCCGGCGKMRRAEVEGRGPKLGMTSRSHPWSWGRANVPYYCAHHCLWWEVMSTEDLGYPLRIHGWSDDPRKPCPVYFYKDPGRIPESYFARIGKTRKTLADRHC